MTGSQIQTLGPITGVKYKPDGTIRSFLVDYNGGHYGFYCKELRAYGSYITIEQIQEIQELLKSPFTQPNREELQEY